MACIAPCCPGAGSASSCCAWCWPPSCVRLGFWQLHRFEDHRAANAAGRAQRGGRPGAGRDAAAGRAGRSSSDAEWRRVTATGEYDVSGQLLVRQRPLDGANGYQVLTPLVTSGGGALIVNRGWMPAGASATTVASGARSPDRAGHGHRAAAPQRDRAAAPGRPAGRAGPPDRGRARSPPSCPTRSTTATPSSSTRQPAPAQALTTLPVESRSRPRSTWPTPCSGGCSRSSSSWAGTSSGRREALDEQARQRADREPAEPGRGAVSSTGARHGVHASRTTPSSATWSRRRWSGATGRSTGCACRASTRRRSWPLWSGPRTTATGASPRWVPGTATRRRYRPTR